MSSSEYIEYCEEDSKTGVKQENKYNEYFEDDIKDQIISILVHQQSGDVIFHKVYNVSYISHPPILYPLVTNF